MKKKKIIFFVEAVTAAHLIRVLPLAQEMTNEYDVLLATKNPPENIVQEFPLIQFISLETTVSPILFLEALYQGKLPYDEETLKLQIAEDFQIFNTYCPDLVVADFRLSLSISAESRQTPVIHINNAFWNPSYLKQNPLPDVPIVRLLGEFFSSKIAWLVEDKILKKLLDPFNKLRVQHGLSPFDSIRALYSFGTILVHPDPKELYLNANQFTSIFIGPNAYVPKIASPEWIHLLDINKQTIYISLGSSGQSKRFINLIPSLIQLPYQWIILSSDEEILKLRSKNVFTAKFAPLDELVDFVDVAIINGGSAQGYFFLGHGVPIVGVASNMDQHLFMQTVLEAQIGFLARSEKVTLKELTLSIESGLNDVNLKARCLEFEKIFSKYNSSKKFKEIVKKFLSRK